MTLAALRIIISSLEFGRIITPQSGQPTVKTKLEQCQIREVMTDFAKYRR
jgi:hypothetical protein